MNILHPDPEMERSKIAERLGKNINTISAHILNINSKLKTIGHSFRIPKQSNDYRKTTSIEIMSLLGEFYKRDQSVSIEEIANKLGKTRQTIASIIFRLDQDGKVVKLQRGRYAPANMVSKNEVEEKRLFPGTPLTARQEEVLKAYMDGAQTREKLAKELNTSASNASTLFSKAVKVLRDTKSPYYKQFAKANLRNNTAYLVYEALKDNPNSSPKALSEIIGEGITTRYITGVYGKLRKLGYMHPSKYFIIHETDNPNFPPVKQSNNDQDLPVIYYALLQKAFATDKQVMRACKLSEDEYAKTMQILRERGYVHPDVNFVIHYKNNPTKFPSVSIDDNPDIPLIHHVVNTSSTRRNPGYMSKRLGISKERVIKAIEALKDRGYLISLKDGFKEPSNPNSFPSIVEYEFDKVTSYGLPYTGNDEPDSDGLYHRSYDLSSLNLSPNSKMHKAYSIFLNGAKSHEIIADIMDMAKETVAVHLNRVKKRIIEYKEEGGNIDFPEPYSSHRETRKTNPMSKDVAGRIYRLIKRYPRLERRFYLEVLNDITPNVFSSTVTKLRKNDYIKHGTLEVTENPYYK